MEGLRRCGMLVVVLLWGCGGAGAGASGADTRVGVGAQDLGPELPGPEVVADALPDAPSLDLEAELAPTDLDTASEVQPDPWTSVRETLDEGPACTDEPCALLGNEAFDGAGLQVSNEASFDQESDGLVYRFRAFSRLRAPQPGTLGRVWLYTKGAGAVRLQLSTGFPGGHSPCLDEATGADLYPVGPQYRMEVSADAGWRRFDLGDLQHPVGGYDELYFLMDQEGETRIGLAPALASVPGDYASNSGLIADAPGDKLRCFAATSVFGGDGGGSLAFIVRAELRPQAPLDTPRGFAPLEGGPSFGGHAALGDFDNDGDDDLLSGGQLWRNDGDLKFVNVTAAAGLTGLAGETLFGDYDNDGLRDLVGVGSATFLFRNRGDGTFEDASAWGGLFTGTSNQGAAWVDVNADGLLDLMVASYGTLEDPEVAAKDFLFINAGDGSFYNGTSDFGISVAKAWHGRGVCVADYDADGDPDIYVGNYRLDPNLLWQNQGGEGGFKEVGAASGTRGNLEQGAYGHTIGPSFGDLDGDGWFDLLVPNLAHPRFFSFSDPTIVYLNNRDGTFRGLEPPDAGILYDETHSDSTLFDADNDGDLDLFLTAVYEGRRSYLYLNDGTGQFSDGTWEAGILHLNGWGAAAADLDNDGDQDLAANRIFQNQAPGGNWLQLRLVGGARPGDHLGWSNRDAIGAVVRVTAGPRTLTRQVEGGKGVGCQNSARLHFGLGDQGGPVAVQVLWPSGRTTSLEALATGQLHVIDEKGEPR